MALTSRQRICVRGLRSIAIVLIGSSAPALSQNCPYADSTAIPDTLDPSLYFPMEVGNTWEYVNPERHVFSKFYSDRIVSDTLIGGTQFFKFERQYYELWVDGWVARANAEVRYMAVVESRLISRTPGGPTDDTGHDFTNDFNSCDAVATGGSYGGQIQLPYADSTISVDVAAEKCFGVDRDRHCYAHGIGVYEYPDLPPDTYSLVFAKIRDTEIGTRLVELYEFAPVVSDTLDWRGYYPLEIGNAWEVTTSRLVAYRAITREEIVGDTLIRGREYFVESTYHSWYDEADMNGGTTRGSRYLRYDTTRNEVVELSGSGGGERPLSCNLASNFNVIDADCWIVADAFVSGEPPGFLRIGSDTVHYAAVKEFYNLGGGVAFYHGIGPVWSIGDGGVGGRSLTYLRLSGKEYGNQKVFVGTDEESPGPVSSLQLFPNPASQTLTVDLGDGVGELSVEVYDALGRLVVREDQCVSPCRVDVSDMAAGAYVASLSTESGYRRSAVFVVAGRSPATR